ncbi:MAG TPA: NAD(P)-dependent oxidoreductase, partial [Candidatus Limnocylindrales bacterium]|nr:NAD(P)-dependent oxidoreductase [Candidatus Limnocylindrales bacterium]
VFEAVRRSGTVTTPVVYTGSIGMFSLSDADPVTNRLAEDAVPHPGNHYGVYKLANEGTAQVYWQDNGIASVGLRPMTVYGAGRDQGMTSSPTVAIAAAVLGVPFRISFGGSTLFQYAQDVAATLILASRSPADGAHVFNLGGSPVPITDWIEAIDAAVPGARDLLTFEPAPLPFPPDIQHDRLARLGAVPVTPYADAIAATAGIFRSLADRRALVAGEQGIPDATAGASATATPAPATAVPPTNASPVPPNPAASEP